MPHPGHRRAWTAPDLFASTRPSQSRPPLSGSSVASAAMEDRRHSSRTYQTSRTGSASDSDWGLDRVLYELLQSISDHWVPVPIWRRRVGVACAAALFDVCPSCTLESMVLSLPTKQVGGHPKVALEILATHVDCAHCSVGFLEVLHSADRFWSYSPSNQYVIRQHFRRVSSRGARGGVRPSAPGRGQLGAAAVPPRAGGCSWPAIPMRRSAT